MKRLLQNLYTNLRNHQWFQESELLDDTIKEEERPSVGYSIRTYKTYFFGWYHYSKITLSGRPREIRHLAPLLKKLGFRNDGGMYYLITSKDDRVNQVDLALRKAVTHLGAEIQQHNERHTYIKNHPDQRAHLHPRDCIFLDCDTCESHYPPTFGVFSRAWNKARDRIARGY